MHRTENPENLVQLQGPPHKIYMVGMPEWFRGHTVDVVYVGSNPTAHPIGTAR